MHFRYLRFDRRDCRLEKQSRRGGHESHTTRKTVIRSGGNVVIRSPSGDTDITDIIRTLTLALIDDLVKVYFD